MATNNNITNLVFSSGGIYGVSFMGTYACLLKHNVLKNIKCYSGCSAGAIFALLANLSLPIVEIEKFINKLDYDKLNDINFLDINSKLGFESGKKIMDCINEVIIANVGTSSITFEELHIKTGKKLYINAVCITDNKIEYFSVDTAPKMEVSLAIRMSISIPFIFVPVKYNNKLYVDGGMLEYIPNIFPTNSLVIKIDHVSTENITFDNNTNNINPTNLKDYCLKLYLCLFSNLRVTTHESDNVIIIKIPNMDLITFSLTPRLRKRLYKYGYRAAREYINSEKTHVL